MNHAPDHIGPLPYEEATEPDFAATAADGFVIESYPYGLLLRGPCPRCGAAIEVPLVDRVIERRILWSGHRPAPSVGGPDERVEPIICTCEEAHPGRPEGRVGCGAFWNFVVPEAAE